MPLQRPEARDRVVDRAHRRTRVRKRRQRRGQHPVVVVGDRLLDQPAHRCTVRDRVQAAPPHELAHLGLDRVDRAHVAPFRCRTDDGE